jgi:hypothetical protein
VLTSVKSRLKKGRRTSAPSIETTKAFVKTHFKKEIEGKTKLTEGINIKAKKKRGRLGRALPAANPKSVGGGAGSGRGRRLRKQSGGASSAAAGGGGPAADEQEFQDDPSYDLKQLFFYNIPTDKEISDSTNHIKYVPNHPINILYLLYLSVEMAIVDNELYEEYGHVRYHAGQYDQSNLQSLLLFMKRIFFKFKTEYDKGDYKGKGPYKSKYYTSFAMGKYVYKFIRKLYAYSFEEDTQIDLSLLFSLLEYYFGCYMSTLELEGNYNDFLEITVLPEAPPGNYIDKFVDDLQTEMVCEWITRYILKEDFDITGIQEVTLISTEEPHSLINPIEEGGLVSLLESIKEKEEEIEGGHKNLGLISALNKAIQDAKKEQQEKQEEQVQAAIEKARKHVFDADDDDKPGAIQALQEAEARLAAGAEGVMNDGAQRRGGAVAPAAAAAATGAVMALEGEQFSRGSSVPTYRGMGDEVGAGGAGGAADSPPQTQQEVPPFVTPSPQRRGGSQPITQNVKADSISSGGSSQGMILPPKPIKTTLGFGQLQGGVAGGSQGSQPMERKTRRKRRGLSNKSRRYRFF